MAQHSTAQVNQSKVQFERTVEFIYDQTSKRLNLKKDELGVSSNYQIAGFKNQKEYNEAPNYSKIDDSNLSNILNNKRQNRKNKYLIPSQNAEMYYQAFVSNLKFDSVHELLWGKNSEIKTYLPQLFQNIMLDSLENSNEKIKNICSDLMKSRSEKNLETKIYQIYEENKEELLKEFIDFTKAKNSKEHLESPEGIEYEIVGIKRNVPIIDKKKSKNISGTKLNEYLGYQRLNKAFEKFIEDRLLPLFLNNLILQFNQQKEEV